MPDKDDFKDVKEVNKALRYISLSTEMLVILGLAVWGGLKLDERWNTQPLMIIVLPILGLVIIFYRIFKMFAGK